jgi:hypothetical protein
MNVDFEALQPKQRDSRYERLWLALVLIRFPKVLTTGDGKRFIDNGKSGCC